MASFNAFFSKLLAEEGGQTTDTGGFTNKGITLDIWKQYGRDLDADGDIDANDLKKITNNDAYTLYKSIYWDKLSGDNINSQIVAELLFDHAVNAGPSRAIKMIQSILNTYFGYHLVIDGGMGPLTIAAINKVDPNKLASYYKQYRNYYYLYLAAQLQNIPSIAQSFFKSINLASNASVYGQYLNGWLKRVDSFVVKNSKSFVVPFTIVLGLGLFWYFSERE